MKAQELKQEYNQKLKELQDELHNSIEYRQAALNVYQQVQARKKLINDLIDLEIVKVKDNESK